MNMFRHLLTVAFLALGICLWFIPTDQWKWVDLLGGPAISVVDFLGRAEPFSTLLCLVVGTALFMTRKQY